jgi:hypothetical protein
MSWRFLQGQAEASWEGPSLDGAPSALSRLIPTPNESSWPASETESSAPSRSGMTCAPSTDIPGLAMSISSPEGSPARTSAPREKGPESTASGPDSGLSSHASFVRFDRDSCLWRTPQCSLLEGLDEFSETWPNWGSMRNGACWARTMPVLRTFESGSGFWPTPTVNGNHNRKGLSPQSGDGLATAVAKAVKAWPTPRAQDGAHSGCRPTPTTARRVEAGQANLSEAVLQFPTPCARDFRSPNSKPFSERGGGRKGEQFVNYAAHRFPTPRAASSSDGGIGLDGGSGARKALVEQFGETEAKALGLGQLNPEWVEWLMGWPRGWTDLGPMSLLTFREWQEASRTESVA